MPLVLGFIFSLNVRSSQGSVIPFIPVGGCGKQCNGTGNRVHFKYSPKHCKMKANENHWALMLSPHIDTKKCL